MLRYLYALYWHLSCARSLRSRIVKMYVSALIALNEEVIAMFRNILVAVDGSPLSSRAIDVAVDIAKHYGAKLCLLHAFPHVSDLLGTPEYERLLETRMLIGQSLIEAARTQVGDQAEVEVQLLEGPPAQAILRVAEEENFDLIVMGSRGHSPLVGLLLGSVSSTVAQRAHCPVLIVH
jgi:nucleotide-binding universal stress UspA family protein